MSLSDVSICSRVLVQLGAEPISSLSDGTDAAKICANVYPSLKTAIIGSYPWRPFMKKKALTRDAEAPIGEWEYSYVISGEFISIPNAVFTDGNDTVGDHSFEIFGRRVYCNHAQLFMDGVVERPETDWPSYFAELMVKALGAAIAFSITDQQNVADSWKREAYGSPSEMGKGGAMGAAMALDAQSSGNTGIYNDTFVDARHGWGH